MFGLYRSEVLTQLCVCALGTPYTVWDRNLPERLQGDVRRRKLGPAGGYLPQNGQIPLECGLQVLPQQLDQLNQLVNRHHRSLPAVREGIVKLMVQNLAPDQYRDVLFIYCTPKPYKMEARL